MTTPKGGERRDPKWRDTCSNTQAPPIGLCPRYIHDEQRVREILEAMLRFVETPQPVPKAWLQELTEKLVLAEGQ